MLLSSRDAVSETLKIPLDTEAFWVESVVKSCIIHSWESQDEPEHLRTIRDRLCRCAPRDRILRNEQRAGRSLGIFYDVLVETPINSAKPRNLGQNQPKTITQFWNRYE